MRLMTTLIVLLLPALVWAKDPNLAAPKTKTWTLANGLKVIFVEEHRAPVVAVQVFYHAGGKDEPADKRGIAHMFEHMMFKGSRHVRPEEHARIIDAFGGNSNAFTQDDLTAYHDTIPPAALGFTLKLEAERMRNLTLTQKTIDSEREVVKEELRVSLENNPVMKAVDKVKHLAFQKHPYQQSPIGEKKMLDTVTIADCEKFYNMYYRPNNAILIVAGDTDEATLRPMIDEHFGKLEPGPTPVRNTIEEPEQKQLREEAVQIPVQIPVMIGAYHVPKAADDDIYVIEVIQQILSGGESSRLHKRLVKAEQLSLGAGGVVFKFEDPGLFLTYAFYLPGKDSARIHSILDEEVRKLKSDEIDAKELQKAKNQLAARAVYAQERVAGMATQMGVNAIIAGDPMRVFEAPAKYDAVTVKDIRRVAKKYFVNTNYSVATLIPSMGAK